MKGGLTIPSDGYEPKEALDKLKELLISYAEFYKRGIIHHNIKPKNILIT
jgi:serine/threonine protein kinase